MRRVWTILAAAFVLYAGAMAWVWHAATALAHEKTMRELVEAREGHVHVMNEIVESILWYATRVAFDEIGTTPSELPVERMREVANRIHLDEVNIVASNGVVIASSVPSVLGHDFHDNPRTAEFLRLFDPTNTEDYCMQTFRAGIVNPEDHCLYYAVPYPDRNALLEIGLSAERYRNAVSLVPIEGYRHWEFGIHGYFCALDRDGDGIVDVGDPESGDDDAGEMGSFVDDTGETVYTYTFTRFGVLLQANVPASEFFEQRRQTMFLSALAGAVVLGFLAFFLARLARVSARVDALHRAEEARNASDLALAHDIQMSALPQADAYRVADLRVALSAHSRPAREVGGDFYNFYDLPDGRLAFLIADVSGKGIPAAMFMHVSNHVLYQALRQGEDLAAVAESVNDYLCAHNDAGMFVTAWIGTLDPATGEVTYVNAGHNRPYRVPAAGAPERLEGKGGLPLGLYAKRHYRVHRLALSPGDRIFLFTDGVTEAMDARQRVYGEARLVGILSTHPDNLVDAVRGDVAAHAAGAEPSDDLTGLSLVWNGVPVPEARTFPAAEASAGPAVEFLRGAVRLADAKQKARLLNAADEMIANVIGYSGAADFTLAVENVPGRARVTIRDAGRPYDPLTHTDPDTHAALADRPIGGLGILMTKKLVRSVAYCREGRENILVLVQCEAGGGGRRA